MACLWKEPIVLWVSSLDRNVHRNRRNKSIRPQKSQGLVKVRDVVKLKDQTRASFRSRESITLRIKSNRGDTKTLRVEGASQNKD